MSDMSTGTAGTGVPGRDVVADGADQDLYGGEGAAADGLRGGDAEPGLDLVHPAGALEGEVEVHVRVRVQPGLDLRSGVGGQVVRHHMHVTPTVRGDRFRPRWLDRRRRIRRRGGVGGRSFPAGRVARPGGAPGPNASGRGPARAGQPGETPGGVRRSRHRPRPAMRVAGLPLPGRDQPAHDVTHLPGGDRRGVSTGRQPHRVQRRSPRTAARVEGHDHQVRPARDHDRLVLATPIGVTQDPLRRGMRLRPQPAGDVTASTRRPSAARGSGTPARTVRSRSMSSRPQARASYNARDRGGAHQSATTPPTTGPAHQRTTPRLPARTTRQPARSRSRRTLAGTCPGPRRPQPQHDHAHRPPEQPGSSEDPRRFKIKLETQHRGITNRSPRLWRSPQYHGVHRSPNSGPHGSIHPRACKFALLTIAVQSQVLENSCIERRCEPFR